MAKKNKNKDKPILSKEEKVAKKALKKKNQNARVKKKKEKRVANKRKREEEALKDEEEALANPRSTASTSKKSKQEETEGSSRSTASTSKKKKKSTESPAAKAERKRRKKLKKLEKLRKPLILTDEEQRRVNRLRKKKTIAFWDYENLPYKVGAFQKIKKKLRREGYTGELELHAFVGYKGDPEPENDNTFTMHYGDLKHRPKVGTRGDQKSDNHMYSVIDTFIKEKKGAPQNTLLITNDNGFKEKMDSLREAGHGVLLATTQESLIIKSGSHRVWFWKYEIVDVNED